MEAPEKEKETEKIRTKPTVRLSSKEAERLYWATVAPSGRTGQSLPYEKYRANLMAAIPFIGYTQSSLRDPLKEAVWMRDTEFVKFLLEHGADPNFRTMTTLSAYDYLNYGNACGAAIPAPQNPYPGSVEEIQSLLNKYSAQIERTKFSQ